MGGSSPTIGYKYYLGVHAGICIGPVDEVRALYFEDRKGWEGSISTNATITVNSPELFGGEKQEGGVQGLVDVLMGGQTQTPNAYLQSKIGSDVPAYRGILSLVFRGSSSTSGSGSGGVYLGSILAGVNRAFYWSSMNPYIKPVSVEVKRILSGWLGGTAWYSAKAAIGNNMNPAHIIYQAMTDTSWGAGLPTALLNNSAFTAAADTLYDESFGLSLIWAQQQSVEDFIKEILRHVDGALYFDPPSGQFTLALNRFDYDPETLPQFGPSEISEMLNYTRAAWGETTNEVILTYTDAATEETASVAVQDLSNIRIQGGVVSTTRNYAGVRDADLAYKIAERDLRVVSTPLASIRFTINRSAWNLVAGSVFRVSWPDYGLTDVVFRAASVDYGTLTDGLITVDAVEDVFALPTNSYGAGQDSLWSPPQVPPAAIVNQKVTEATYYDLVRYFGTDAIAEFPTDRAFPIVVAEKSATQNSGFVVYVSPTDVTEDFVEAAVGTNTPTVTIPSAITDREQTTVVYSTANNFSWDGALGSYAYWDNEIIQVESVVDATKTLTIKRGVLDSIPTTHSANSKIWFWDSELGAIYTDSDASRGETTYVRTVGLSPGGRSSVASAASTAYVQQGRWYKPWPPAKVTINGAYFPTQGYGDVSLSWVGRNRLQQDVDLVGWYEGHIAPEDGTSYRVTVYNDNTNAVLYQNLGVTSASAGVGLYWAGASGSSVTRYRIEIESVRGGLACQNKFVHAYDLRGWSMQWGSDWSGGIAGSILRVGDISFAGGFAFAFPILYANSRFYLQGFPFINGAEAPAAFESVDGINWGFIGPLGASAGVGTPLGRIDDTPDGVIYASGKFYSTTIRNSYNNGSPNSTTHSISTATSFGGPWTTVYFPLGYVSQTQQPIGQVWTGTQIGVILSNNALVLTDGTTLNTPQTITGPGLQYTDGSGLISNIVLAPTSKIRMAKVGSYYYMFIANSGAGPTRVIRSTDLLTWELCPGSGFDVTTWQVLILNDMLIDGSTIYVCGGGCKFGGATEAYYGVVLKCTDGLNFTEVRFNGDQYKNFTQMSKVGSRIVAVEEGTGYLIYSTNNGTSWTVNQGVAVERIRSSGSRAIALRRNSNGWAYDLMTTVDWINWSTMVRV